MYQHLHQDHLPLQLLKYQSNSLPFLHPIRVKPNRHRIHQVKVQDCYQSHRHGRHQPYQDTEHQDVIRKV